MKRHAIPIAFALLLSTTIPVSGSEFKGAETITIAKGDTLVGDLYSWSRHLKINGVLQGSAISAAQRITVDGTITDDLNTFSESLTINGIVKRNVRRFGRYTRIYGTVEGEVLVMGEEVEIGEDAIVQKDLCVAAGTVIIDGTIKGSVKGGGGRIIISGTIEGDVDLKGEEFEILPTARISGNLSYETDEELYFEEGIVAGSIDYNKPSRHDRKRDKNGSSAFGFLFNLWSLVAAILIGILLILITKGKLSDTYNLIERQPLKSLGVGFLLTACIPAVVIVLVFLILTIPAALILTAIYLVLLYVSKILVGMFVGEKLLTGITKKRSSIYLSLIVGLIVIYVSRAIPFFGFLIGFAVLFFGMGIIGLSVFRMFNNKSEATV